METMDIYQSPFSWRYGSPAMRRTWSEEHKRLLWRKIWLALAETQMEYGLVSPEQAADLREHVGDIDLPRALAIEAEIHHDLMAELKCYAEQCLVGGGVLHLGATSMDIEDNADALRLCESLDLIGSLLDELLLAFAARIDETAETPVMAFTHLQPAEPTTLGYRLAGYAQDLLSDRKELTAVRTGLRGKGFKGAVGTAAAYADLIGLENIPQFEEKLSLRLNLPFFSITTQTYPRRQDLTVMNTLAGIGATLYKFAFDLRFMQSPLVGEWAEPFGRKQVGSSAMPFKRNPINAEKIDSLARLLAGMPQSAWQNAAHSLLERTLDDSANRRSLLPEAFLISDELLSVSIRLVKGMQFNSAAMRRNLEQYAPFAATERVLMALVRAGADRQQMHERLRGLALSAWEAVQSGEPNPLAGSLQADHEIHGYLADQKLTELFSIEEYTGIAGERAQSLAKEIRRAINV